MLLLILEFFEIYLKQRVNTRSKESHVPILYVHGYFSSVRSDAFRTQFSTLDVQESRLGSFRKTNIALANTPRSWLYCSALEPGHKYFLKNSWDDYNGQLRLKAIGKQKLWREYTVMQLLMKCKIFALLMICQPFKEKKKSLLQYSSSV